MEYQLDEYTVSGECVLKERKKERKKKDLSTLSAIPLQSPRGQVRLTRPGVQSFGGLAYHLRECGETLACLFSTSLGTTSTETRGAKDGSWIWRLQQPIAEVGEVCE